jgi:hypothetical protein
MHTLMRGAQGTADPALNPGRRYGSFDWLETYCRSPAFEKLKERTKPSYHYQLRLLADVPTKTSCRLGDLPASSITPAAVDKIYESLPARRQRRNKLRRANHTIDIAKKAWTVVREPTRSSLSSPTRSSD